MRPASWSDRVGWAGVKSALLGSVSSGVLDHAQLPVLIVPPLEEAHAPGR